MRETITIDARIARNLKNGADPSVARTPAVAREIRSANEAVPTGTFGEVEVPAYELTWLVAEAEGSPLVAKAAISEATTALEEAGIW